MAIDKISSNIPVSGETLPNPSKPPSVTENRVDDDSVNFTQLAQDLKNAIAKSSNDDFIDINRVKQIQQAIKDGSYTFDAEKIADKLIQMEKDLP